MKNLNMPILQERGYFWRENETIPNERTRPLNSVAGELIIDEDGKISLELDGAFPAQTAPRTIAITAGKKNYEMQEQGIRGCLNNNQNIYLYGLMGDRFLDKHFTVRDCFIGRKQFPETDNILSFRKLGIDLKGFQGWFCFSFIEHCDSEDELSIVYKKTKDVVYDIGDAKITIHRGIDLSLSADVSLKQGAYFTYEAKGFLSLTEIRNKYRHIEDFFILLTNSEYRMDWPTVFLASNEAEYRYYFSRHKGSDTPPDWHECWTNFPMISEKFGQLFLNWESKHQIFGSGFYLYLATRRGVPAYVENRFLDLMMGFESFHRRKNPDASDSNAVACRERALEQIKNVNMSDYKWLKRRLKNAHEPPAAYRLKEIFENIPIQFDKKKINDFVSECSCIRNDMVHANRRGEQEGSLAFLIDLDKRSDALSCLYHVLILSEIGIDQATVNAIVERRYEIKRDLISVGLLDESAYNST